MNQANWQNKIYNVINDLNKHVTCPKCGNENNALQSLSCGHLLCAHCIPPTGQAKRNCRSTFDCPVCRKKINPLEICSDDLFNLLIDKTTKLCEFLKKPKNKLNVAIEGDKLFSKPSNAIKEKMSKIEHPVIVQNFDSSNETTNIQEDISHFESALNDKALQTEVLTAEVRHIEKTSRSIGTQTDFQLASENCCIKANLMKILQLNICDSFNAIITGLMQMDACNNKQNMQISNNISDEIVQTDFFANDSPQSYNIPSTKNIISTAPVIVSKSNDEIEVQINEIPKNSIEDVAMKDLNCMVTIDEAKIDEPKPNSIQETSNQPVEQKREEMPKIYENNESILNEVSSKEKPKPIKQTRKRPITNTIESSYDDIQPSSSKSKRPVLQKSIKSMQTTESQDLFRKPEKSIKINNSTKKYTKIKSPKTSIGTDLDIIETKSDSFSSASAVLTRSRERSSSNEKKSYVIMTAGLDSSQKRKLEKHATILNLKVVTDWNDNITHLVVNLAKDTLKKDLLATRSIKYLMALVGHRWIVSFDWIAASIKSNKTVDEQNYEIRGTRGCKKIGCPKLSRTVRGSFFLNFVIFFKEPILFNGDLSNVKEIVEIGGGIVVKSEEEFVSKMENCKEMKFFLISDEASTLVSGSTSAKHLTINTFIDLTTEMSDFDEL